MPKIPKWEIFDLYILYLELEDGIGWNPTAKVATFESHESARAFKLKAQGWSVRHRQPKKEKAQ